MRDEGALFSCGGPWHQAVVAVVRPAVCVCVCVCVCARVYV